MHTISANVLKQHGISVAQSEEETLITVRGQPAYVIMSIDRYETLNAIEIEQALEEARRDYKNGRYVTESVAKHVKRMTK